MNVLTDWKVRSDENYLYCTGRLNGRRWMTSNIVQLIQETDRYVVFTENSIYHLYW